jgi:hypothetical protein
MLRFNIHPSIGDITIISLTKKAEYNFDQKFFNEAMLSILQMLKFQNLISSSRVIGSMLSGKK